MSEINFEFIDYPRTVKIAEHRNPTYYRYNKMVTNPKYPKLPKKYQSPQYSFVQGRLYDLKTNLPVVKNSKTVGTERYKVISGQLIYNASYGVHQRAFIIKFLKAYFEKEIYRQAVNPQATTQHLPQFKKLSIECKIYDYLTDEHTKGQKWDLDNRSVIYNKCFIDVLKVVGIIEDDNSSILTKLSNEFICLEKGGPRKLVYTLKNLDNGIF